MTHDIEALVFRGRTIVIEIREHGRKFLWRYRIDGGPIVTCEDTPLSTERRARSEALTLAKESIRVCSGAVEASKPFLHLD